MIQTIANTAHRPFITFDGMIPSPQTRRTTSKMIKMITKGLYPT